MMFMLLRQSLKGYHHYMGAGSNIHHAIYFIQNVVYLSCWEQEFFFFFTKAICAYDVRCTYHSHTHMHTYIVTSIHCIIHVCIIA